MGSRLSVNESELSLSKSSKQKMSTKNILQGLEDEDEEPECAKRQDSAPSPGKKNSKLVEQIMPSDNSVVETEQDLDNSKFEEVNLNVRGSNFKFNTKDEEDEDSIDQVPLTPQKLLSRYKKQNSKELEQQGIAGPTFQTNMGSK
jgi:hypothetical protein